jgi:hypothetical protein
MKRMNLSFLLLVLIFLTACTNSVENNKVTATLRASPEIVVQNQMHELSEKQLEELKPIVKNLFTNYLESEKISSVPSERRIKDFKIHEDIKTFRIDSNSYFIVTYDTLAASKEFVLAGGGQTGENGWFIDRTLYVEIQMENGGYKIKNLSSGP